ncbi:RidA family protein [Actinokineospora inagensis]|uniref:RidA family protein n=1 Tax=Actinokineospora inagensis TaxID=103730 RepID=UPI0004011615|nr:RidA family protein [Actinokineospora inagensis]
MTPHRIVTAPDLAPPSGYAHAVVATPGHTVHLGGQTALDHTGTITGSTIEAQFDQAAANIVSALTAAGTTPAHLVSVLIYVTDVPTYKAALPALTPLWRKHFGRHYPAIALLGVTALFDPEALIELVATAVIPTPT